MNKADKGYLVFSFVLGIALLFTPRLWQTTGNKYALVEYHGSEVLRIDLEEDASYEVQGDLGPVVIEVKDRKVRVEKEESPYHYCSMQGWVEYSNVPIVCLPNGIIVKIMSDKSSGTDTIVQ